MLFNSYSFLVFFPIVVFAYFLIPQKAKNYWLLIASYYFYMSWNIKYALLMAVTTLITFLSGIYLNSVQNKPGKIVKKKSCVVLTLVFNLGILFFFKYSNFALNTLERVLIPLGIAFVKPEFDIILPVGISFYTFQALSYTLDVYYDRVKATKNLATYALYISFFPQLVAGPIERSCDLLPQFYEEHKFEYSRCKQGLLLMLWGFFIKVVIADRAAQFVNVVYNNYSEYAGVYLVIATILFAVQIYCDFWGYSSIARGAAQVMGFKLMENFKQPYLSISIAEFWRRWHVSLSSWLRDYVYFPLGGSRCSRVKKYRNLMITFLASGLWHGASWNYVVWGGVHGLYQIAGDLLKPVRVKLLTLLRIDQTTVVHRCVQCGITFILTCFAWIFFRANGTRAAIAIIKQIVTQFDFAALLGGQIFEISLSRSEWMLLLLSVFALMIVDLLKLYRFNLQGWLQKQHIAFRWIVYLCVIFSIIVFGIYGLEYNASEFIYFQF